MVLVGTVTFTTNGSICRSWSQTSKTKPLPGPLLSKYQVWLTVPSQVKSRQSLRLVLSPPFPDCEFDITISNLPEKLSFSPEFQGELEAVGGNIESSFEIVKLI